MSHSMTVIESKFKQTFIKLEDNVKNVLTGFQSQEHVYTFVVVKNITSILSENHLTILDLTRKTLGEHKTSPMLNTWNMVYECND